MENANLAYFSILENKLLEEYRDIIRTTDDILFYLYVKNPPNSAYINKSRIKNLQLGNKEFILSNVFLNLAKYPIWWKIGNNEIENIAGKPYLEFENKYKELETVS